MAAIIQLLGRPGIHRPFAEGGRLRGRKTWSLLAVLALRGHPATRRALAGLLFPAADDPAAALRWALSELRRGLGDDAVVGGDPVTLALSPGTVVDAQLMLSGQAPADFDAGELLAGLVLPDCPEFELWLSQQRERVSLAAQAALRSAVTAELGARRPAEAVRLARRLVQLAPLTERHQVLLVSSLAAAGDRAGARAAADACTRLFERELGVRPSPRLAQAERAPAAGLTLLPDGRRLKARLEIEAGKAMAAAGAAADGLERLRSAVRLADELDDQMIRGEANAALGTTVVHTVALTAPEGVAALLRARDLARTAGDRATAASAGRELAFVATGARRGAGALLRQARELAGGDDAKLAATLGVEAIALVDSGRHEAGVRRFRRAIDLAEQAGEPRKAALSLTNLARAHLTAGDPGAARVCVDRALTLVAEQRWTAFLPFPQAVSAELDLLEGRADSAGELLACAWTAAVELADPCWLAITGRGLGLLAARQGDVTAAMQWLDSAYHQTGAGLPQVCRWIDAATIDTICEVATAYGLPRAAAGVAELEALAVRARMPRYAARARYFGDLLTGKDGRVTVPV
ncbi:BTAD domain-containing putative transcriptional regulator [Actinoplanes sp. NPDC026670]|uniref:BTAD domain-containing putative transcriptional regulator n=1 Tax=Actinoplanes sp. NPDC026670 TaxID=3154700 RepID=UPI0033F81A88